MFRHHHRRSFDDFGSHRGLGEIGEPYDEAPPFLVCQKTTRHVKVVGLGDFLVYQRKLFDELTQVRAAFSGWKLLTNRTAVSHESHAVSGVQRHLGQSQCGVDRMVQLAEASYARSHQAPRVDDDPHGLAPFNLINAADQLSAPCRRGPANVTILVPLPIFAQAFKLAANPANSGAASFDGDLTASKQKNGVAFRVFQIGINSYGLRYGSSNPSLRDAEDASIAHITITQLHISSLPGADSIPH